MGWTWQHATHYKNGKVDRKAECDAYFNEDNKGCYVVEKSALVGTVYYAAIRYIGRRNYKTNEITEIPASEQEVFAVIFLTGMNVKDYFNFGYKDMEESMHPYYYDCPAGILKLLSPTDNASANEWRENCRQRAAQKKADKKNPDSLENLPIGTVIRVRDKELVKTAPMAQFKTPFWMRTDAYLYHSKKEIKRCGFEIVSRPAMA